MSNQALVESLKKVLADSYTLYLKTQNYHWNVTGPQFSALHTLFEQQYNDLFTANDLIAERIRALGSKAPGSFKAFDKLSTIDEASESDNVGAEQMVADLAEDQGIILATIKKALKAAQDAEDEVTIGLLADRMEVHEKNAWMLRASLGEESSVVKEVA